MVPAVHVAVGDAGHPMFVQLGKFFLHNLWMPQDAHVSVGRRARIFWDPGQSIESFSMDAQAVRGPRVSPSDMFRHSIPRFTG